MNDTLQKIVDNGLMVRQIPETLAETYSYEPNHEALMASKGRIRGRKVLGVEDIEEAVAKGITPEMWRHRLGNGHYTSKHFRYEDGNVYRKFTVLKIVPKHAGMWMAKPCCHTSSTARWDIERDGVFPTLEEAVNHAVEVLKKC